MNSQTLGDLASDQKIDKSFTPSAIPSPLGKTAVDYGQQNSNVKWASV